ncbi:MAG TPA: copper chaperone PCu(A)C [Streptosporangiaceae bacterium]|nr:copper chaperone PCu(A)C [Streptosporangiaceae bacterium]
MIRSSHRNRLLRRLLIGALAALVPAIAGCAAGTSKATFQYHEAASGAYATAGPVSVINAFVLGPKIGGTLPAGSSASVFLSLYNGSSAADKLVAVTAPGTAAAVTGTPVTIPAGQAVYLTGPHPRLVLSHLTRPVKGAELVTLVLHFQAAGSVTIQAPVEARTSYYATYSPPPPTAPRAAPARSGHPHRGAAGTPSPSPSPSRSPSPSPSR